MRWVKTAAAAAALGAFLALPPYLLISHIGNPWPADGLTWTGPMSDSAVIGLLAAVVCVLWAQFVLCVGAELATALGPGQAHGEDGARRVPVAFGFQRDLAR